MTKHSSLLIDNLYIFLYICNEYIFKKGKISSPQNKSPGVSRDGRRPARQLSNLEGCKASWEFSGMFCKPQASYTDLEMGLLTMTSTAGLIDSAGMDTVVPNEKRVFPCFFLINMSS